MAMNGAALNCREDKGADWVEYALNSPSGWGRRAQIPYALGVIMLFDSWDSTAIAYALPSITAEWGIPAVGAGWLVSVGYGGQFLGALVFGALAERLGRIPILRTLILVMASLSIVCAMATTFQQLLMARLVQGLAIGGAVPVAHCYINEIAPTGARGKFFGSFQFLMLSGFGLAAMLSVAIIPAWGWRFMFLLGATPLALSPLLLLMPESPRWLALRGRIDDALSSLERLGLAGARAFSPQGRELRSPPPSASPFELFASAPRKRILAVGAMWFLTSLVGFGLVTWTPSIYVSNFGMPVETALCYTSLGALAIFFTPLLLRQTIDRIGRRPPAIITTLVSGTALLLMTLVGKTEWGMLITLMIVGHVGISIGTMVLWPYTAEVFETRLRAIALGTSSSLARAASMLTPLAVGGVITLTGSVSLVFALFGSCAILVAILWIFATHETAGRALSS